MSFDLLHKTTGLIHKKDKFVGSAILFPWKGELCALTAGHNLYDKQFDHQPVFSDWQIADHAGVSHPVTAIIGDATFARVHDIIVVKLDCRSTLTDFVCPKFCEIPKNPKHSLLFRGKYQTSATAVTRKKIIYNSIVSSTDHHFLCDIEKALLMDDSYRSGSDWLGGWSGSGLFIDHHTELICAGILCEIPNKGNDGQLLFSSIVALNGLGMDLEIMPATELDFDRALSKISLAAIIEAVDEEAIREWENNNLHKPQLEYINEKLPRIYPSAQVSTNKRRVIKQLLAGKSYLTTELKKNEQLLEQYKSAYQVYNLEDKQVYVNDRPEARSALSRIKDDYEKYLGESLGSDFPAADIKLLAYYGVSEWIADCSLSFLADER